jgi:plastocyanin
MLKTMTKGACALAAAMSFSAVAAHADNHVIEIVDGNYLPVISYVNRGDNLIFDNETEHTHVINGPDDSWTSGPIAPGARFVLNINNQMALTFSGESADGAPMTGEFSYDPAPTGD